VSEPERIISMLASGTELVCALGLGDRLVGRSHECDFPAWVRSLPEVSRPTFDIHGSSRDIDAAVRTRLRDGQPLYQVDDAKLLELAPDILITQTHCEVCAVSPADLVHRLPATLTRKPLVALSGSTLSAILQGFREVAAALGRTEAGAELVELLERKLSTVREAVAGLPRPTVACVEWIEPAFAMGNWGPELVELAGGQNLLGQSGQHSTTTSFEAVLAADPEVLIVAPCGFGLERAKSEMHLVHAQPGFRESRAARAGRVFVCDGNLYFNRSSPSLFETPRILAEMLHPQHFEPSYQGTAWLRSTADDLGQS
jgi:iron complex transport system substrate-binding protein